MSIVRLGPLRLWEDPAPPLDRRWPRPGPVWGPRPERPAADRAPPARGGLGVGEARRARRRAERIADWVDAALDAEPGHGAAARPPREDPLTAQALLRAAQTAREVLDRRPRRTQLLAAAALLDHTMVEMATGEGKTLATALAAAVAAMRGTPVHVVTANDYLAARDAAAHQAFFQTLGLRVAYVAPQCPEEVLRTLYAFPVVYTTAKTLAFDRLRDQHTGRRPVLRGLCLALIDEADSVLLDEADVPLILARERHQPARRASLWQALAIARQLDPAQHMQLDDEARRAVLSPLGEAQVALRTQALGGPWRQARWRREVMGVALSGLWALQRDRDYLVRDGKLALLDTVTGRVAEGRAWSRGLHTVVELKEGLALSPDQETLAQTSFARFFQRYWRLGGLSGTLWEARAELREVFGTPVLRVPLHRPSARVTLAPKVFADEAALDAALVEVVRELHARGRPVLIGTDEVADSERIAAALRTAGLAPAVLNARQDVEEAEIVARAGRAGALTVATRMAGRGTDIELDAAAREAGGLHVIACQHNPSVRLDRQLWGRAARHGDPGSVQAWHLAHKCPTWPWGVTAKLISWKTDRASAVAGPWPGWVACLSMRLMQNQESRRRRVLRRSLLAQDRANESSGSSV